jgi:hypothetical protein
MAFDAIDPALLKQFFRDLPSKIDHVMVTAGRPYYGRLIDLDSAQARSALSEHLTLFLEVARNAANKIRPGAPWCSWAVRVVAAQPLASGSHRH